LGTITAKWRKPDAHFWRWTAFLTTCAALGFGRPVFELHWQNRQVEYAEAAADEQLARSRTGADLYNRLYWLDHAPPSAVEDMLGLPSGHLRAVPMHGVYSTSVEGRLIGPVRRRDDWELGSATRPSYERQPPIDATGWRIVLNFRDGHFASAKADPPALRVAATPARLIRAGFDWVTMATLAAAPFAWLAGLLAARRERTPAQARRFALFALAAALAASAAWAATPGTFDRARGRAGLLVGFVGIAVALHAVGRVDRVRRTMSAHVCFHCGYDLTGNVSGACSECGAATDEAIRRSAAERAKADAERLALVIED
jgi:hypothetical protein